MWFSDILREDERMFPRGVSTWMFSVMFTEEIGQELRISSLLFI